MSSDLENRCSALIEKLGLGSVAGVRSITPLTGGVASDIAAVDLGDRTICAKFALEKFRVKRDWYAPVGRNAAEYAWLEFVGREVAGAVPELFGRDPEANGFAMEFVTGEDIYLWKTALLDRQPTRGEAEKVGDTLGQIHAASAGANFDSSAFQNQSDFYDLRLEPYFDFLVNVHPDASEALRELISTQQKTLLTLIHGDVSPKNVLFRDGEAIILDAECATMGDPSFDVSFCLNHLLIKAFHMPDCAEGLLREAQSFWDSYANHVTWESLEELQSRVCHLLPALMLARIDGKSPLEYLSDKNQARVREFALSHITTPPSSLEALCVDAESAIAGNRLE